MGIGAQQRLSGGFFGSGGSGLDEATLTKIADMTGGRYFRAVDTNTFREIYAELDRLEPIEREQQQWRPRTDLFFWPLSAALLLVLLGLAIREKNE